MCSSAHSPSNWSCTSGARLGCLRMSSSDAGVSSCTRWWTGWTASSARISRRAPWPRRVLFDIMPAMKAIQIVECSGPDSGLALVELPEPEGSHMLTPGAGVVIDVHAAGVSFPEVLQTRGEYQVKPPLPFVPGSEVGGIVGSAPEGSGLVPGD